jgi:hypothetical protein
MSPWLDGLRTYILSNSGLVSEVVYEPTMWQSQPTAISNAQADLNSPLAVAIFGSRFDLFWFNAMNQLQFTTYDPVTEWSKGQSHYMPVEPIYHLY